jgi:hypothetical protein
MAGPHFCRNDAGKGRKKKKKKRHGQTLDLVFVKTTLEKASPSKKSEKIFFKKNQRRFHHRKSLCPILAQKTLPELSRHGQTDGRTNAINNIEWVFP